MEYRGFRSVKEYESECARVGFTTRRVPLHKNGEPYFALITTPPGHPTGTSNESWTLFTADESAEILDGIISGGAMDPARYLRDGHDANYLGKLAARGYYPDKTQESPADAPEYPTAADQICFLF